MKKISRTQFLGAVAIVTSATVMQIRAHIPLHETAPANARSGVFACRSAREGLSPAACESMRSERQAGQQQLRHGAGQLWV